MASEGSKGTQASPPSDTNQLAVDEALQNKIADLSKEEQKGLQETLGALMNVQRARIEYAESRRGSLATTGGVLLAAGVAALLQVAKDGWDYFPGRLGLLTLAVGLAATGVAVISVWAAQTNWDYPFKRVSTTWKHFYRDALPGAGRPVVPWHTRLSQTSRGVQERQYKTGRPGFIDRTVSLVEPRISIAQDIEQSYLLHWSELYKNRFLTSLRQVLVVGVVLSLVAASIALVVGAAVAPDLYDQPGARSETPPSTVTTTTAAAQPPAMSTQKPTPLQTQTGGVRGPTTTSSSARSGP